MGPIRLQEKPVVWWGELGLLLLILGEVWDWGAFPGMGGAREFAGRGHSVSVESLGTGPQRQEQEAGLDKALGMVWLEDAFVVQMGKSEAQRGAEAFPETQSRAGAQVWTPLHCHLALPSRSLGYAVGEGTSSTRSLTTPAKLQRWPYVSTYHTQDTVSGNSACPV